MLYNPKTPTLFKRDENFKVDMLKFTDGRFSNIKRWIVTEKVDGMSVILDPFTDEFHGRTANSTFSDVQAEFLTEQNAMVYNRLVDNPRLDGKEVHIYAELVGPGINGNKHDLKELRLYAFDVRVDGYWLDWLNAIDVMEEAGLWEAPVIDTLDTINDIVSFVRWTGTSVVSNNGYFEGIVARTNPYMYNNKGDRVMFKLKRTDF